jgi:hypothetical protein
VVVTSADATSTTQTQDGRCPQSILTSLDYGVFHLPAVVLRENTEGGPNDGQIGKGKPRRDNSDEDGPKERFRPHDVWSSQDPSCPPKIETLTKLEKQVLNTVVLICVMWTRRNGRSGCLGITNSGSLLLRLCCQQYFTYASTLLPL